MQHVARASASAERGAAPSSSGGTAAARDLLWDLLTPEEADLHVQLARLRQLMAQESSGDVLASMREELAQLRAQLVRMEHRCDWRKCGDVKHPHVCAWIRHYADVWFWPGGPDSDDVWRKWHHRSGHPTSPTAAGAHQGAAGAAVARRHCRAPRRPTRPPMLRAAIDIARTAGAIGPT